MFIQQRVLAALPAALIHLTGTVAVAALAAILVLFVWYPYPYAELSGGRELFFLLVGVDVVCGPLLTLVLFDRRKPRPELIRDLGLVVLIQLGALTYGLFTAMQARPLFLVHEVDRFRVIAQPDFLGADVDRDIKALPPAMRPAIVSRPRLVGTRVARDTVEHAEVLMQTLAGGRDFAQRPNFYIPYDTAYALRATQRARPLARFAEKYPALRDDIDEILADAGVPLPDALFLPVVHRQDWIAILDPKGQIIGFVPGDGFAVR